VLATRTNTTKQGKTQGKGAVSKRWKNDRRVEASEPMKNTNVKPITGRQLITISRETPRFSSEVHVLTGTLVPVVSINTTWFDG
jgi:hypothetical protein